MLHTPIYLQHHPQYYCTIICKLWLFENRPNDEIENWWFWLEMTCLGGKLLIPDKQLHTRRTEAQWLKRPSLTWIPISAQSSLTILEYWNWIVQPHQNATEKLTLNLVQVALQKRSLHAQHNNTLATWPPTRLQHYNLTLSL